MLVISICTALPRKTVPDTREISNAPNKMNCLIFQGCVQDNVIDFSQIFFRFFFCLEQRFANYEACLSRGRVEAEV